MMKRHPEPQLDSIYGLNSNDQKIEVNRQEKYLDKTKLFGFILGQ